MRDGVGLSAHVMTPTRVAGPFPTLLIRTTYEGTSFEWQKLFLDNGYAVVAQYTRGRFGSGGDVYTPHGNAREDGYDTIEWIIKQPWSNGKVGTYGCSFMGETQSILAAAKHPNHIAMIADGGGGAIGSALGSYGYFGVFENGVFNLASALGWHTEFGAKAPQRTYPPEDLNVRLKQNMFVLPVSDIAKQVVDYATGFEDMVSHSLTDQWWETEGYISDNDTFSTAALHVNTWFDQTIQDSFNLARLMEDNAVHPRAKSQHMLIGPGNHCATGNFHSENISVGEMSMEYEDIGIESVFVKWFDYWLKDASVELPPKFLFFQMPGPGWVASDSWPPRNTGIYRLYFEAAETQSVNHGRLIPALPEQESALGYRYDPSNPVPTLGGSICCTGQEDEVSGPVDQGSLESRSDVLIYRSAVLQEKMKLAGDIRVYLGVSTSATDTDYTVKLIDRFPDGRALNLQDGVVRLRYRDGIENPQLAEPGEVYNLNFTLRPLAYEFKPGHQLVIHISSSNFPRLARNLNTGKHEYLDSEQIIADNKIFHGGDFASYIEIPVVRE